MTSRMNIRDCGSSFTGLVAAMLVSALACGGDGSTDPGGAQPRLALPLTDRIVFQSTRSDTLGDIFAMKLDGSDPVRLTGPESRDFCPAVSPDGNWIAYYATPRDSISPDRGPSLVLMRANGTDKHVDKIVFPWGSLFCPVWSPDSKSVLSFDTTPSMGLTTPWGEHLRLYNTDGLMKSEFGAANIFSPALSADGSRILYENYSLSHGGIYDTHVVLRNVDGSGEQWLAAGGNPSWSPDKSLIAFGCDQSCQSDFNGLPKICAGICVMQADGTQITPISATTGAPFFSPDGRTLAIKCLQSSLCSIRLDRTGFTSLVSGGVQGAPVWLPDNSALVYTCNSATNDPYGTKNDICLVRLDGSAPVNLTAAAGPGANSNPSVSPLSAR
jgi:Tol biopolymer transport system component